MRILAVGAHPDDIELQCAGTLACYVQHGHEVFMAVATNGDKGNFDVDMEELASIRKQEFFASCSVIGAKPLWLGYADEYLENNLQVRLHFVDMIRQVDPDLVITHGPDDYHPDHRYTYQLMWDALPLAAVHHVKTDHPATTRQVTMYLMDNFGGVGFTPVELVDITDTIDIKKEALGKHVSQVELFQKLLDVDLMDVVETVGKFRGYQAGAKYAEGFIKVEAWYRGLTNRLLPATEGNGFVHLEKPKSP